MRECFPEPKSSGRRVKLELNLSNCATNADLKNAKDVYTLKSAKKADLESLKPNVDELDTDKMKSVSSNLSNLKSEVDELDLDKLIAAPVDLSKLSDVVKNDTIKKITYIVLR